MIKIMKKTNKMERFLVLVSIAFIVVQVWLELKIPDYMSEVTSQLQMPDTVISDIMQPGMMMVLLSLLSFASSVVVGYFVARIAASLTSRLRGEVYHRVMDYSPDELHKFSIPSLITRTTNDITQIQQVVAMGLQVSIKGPITAVWAIMKIANKNWEWTVSTGVAVVVLLVMLTVILTIVQPKFTVVQGLTDKLNSITRENLTGLRVVRAYNAEAYQNGKFNDANEEMTKVNLFTNRMMAIMSPGMTLVSSGLTLAVYWIGAYLIEAADGAMKITLFSDMVVFSSYAMQVVMGFMLMTVIFLILPRATVSARRINEVLDMEPSIQFPEDSGNIGKNKGEIEFSNVSFTYPNASEAVIKNVSFKAKKGETVAFIGSTGSGKSTIVNLIPRFYDVTEGEIIIDGKNVQSYSHEDLNDRIGYIPQKAVLFSGTIRSNVDFGKSGASPLDDEKINQALDIAQAKDFVEGKEEKLDSHVAQNGTNFSGGQKQRVAIARAVAREPEFLIFDDSFSALDYKTDKKLRDVLAEKVSDTTKLIVAQRISTIMDADEILVLDEGNVVGQGTHHSLLKSNRVYQEIAYSQLSKEELAHG
ncbi:ABC transporter ATP-binding protein [Enterococcus sp. BWM-S5]|uniref:ABC transporter ATP-binding protein n=1 Tax=Enterococcus larvae TaxID=2794352 RepID=A0ABS4CFI8_9ENTE|nr:ABC transporter ATP-binding protein [Enterococcus larvae]MBP1045027.1 ABC transporter ATP-binding protein [Enterococcus larvae]